MYSSLVSDVTLLSIHLSIFPSTVCLLTRAHLVRREAARAFVEVTQHTASAACPREEEGGGDGGGRGHRDEAVGKSAEV